jgi:hypothetical protein
MEACISLREMTGILDETYDALGCLERAALGAGLCSRTRGHSH